MTKFAQSRKGINRTQTYEGAPAIFIPSEKEDLIRRVLTTFVNEPKFYGNVQTQTQQLIGSLQRVIAEDSLFVAKLAIYARNELYMRSIAHVIVGELARSNRGKPFVKAVLYEIAQRPDDLIEVLAYYLTTYGKPIPNSLKKGLAKAFTKFNEYQLQKYNRKKNVQLKDILCLAHPKPSTVEQSDMWKRLLEDNLAIPYTWETELSAKGNTKEVWEQLIESKKVGYMALLRNLRNILAANPSNIQVVLDYIANPDAVKNSKQLPFRFFSAYKAITTYDIFATCSITFETNNAISALQEAIEYSTMNLEVIPGKTILVNDDSASMRWSTPSRDSSITCAEIAALMMAIAHKICEQSITSSFSSTYRIMPLDTYDGILTNTKKVVENCQGGATRMEEIFKYLIHNNIKADRIVIFSDDQSHGYPNAAWMTYKRTIAPNAWLHLIDLAGYGTQVFNGENVTYTPGWSEKILQFIPLVEKGENGIVKYVENL
jgi:60 kDa SS-A/Ro ribonucleoprotein